jgi:holo-[acyl-carrier protein] synthase
MNPVGVGIDLVEVARVERMLSDKGERAMLRLLTESERTYCERQAAPARHVAARLAAKEATYKALNQNGDTGYVGWHEVEVGRAEDGRPSLVMRGKARDAAERLGVTSSLVSLTHTDTQAAAVVLLLG